MIQLIPNEELVSISHFKEITKSFKYEMTRMKELFKNRNVDRNVDRNMITPGTGGGACLSSPNRDTMIQEAAAFRRW